MSFDNVVTAPCALKVNTDQREVRRAGARQFLVDQLKGKGNVIMVTGVAGTFADTERNKGAESVFKKNPGIKVVAKYSGMWDSADRAARHRGAAAVSAEGRRRLGSGGTDGVLKAFIDAEQAAAGRPPARRRTASASSCCRRGTAARRSKGMSIGQPPFLSLRVARARPRGARGAAPQGQHRASRSRYVTHEDRQVSGKTVFPNLPDSFFADFTDSGPTGDGRDLRQGRAHRRARAPAPSRCDCRVLAPPRTGGRPRPGAATSCHDPSDR